MMRPLALALFTCALFSWPGPAISQQDAPPGQYPGDVALSKDSAGNWIYRKFPSLMPLYTYDDDPPGKSACNYGCSGPWPPLRADGVDQNPKPVGDWTVVLREDGRKQWVYKGRPVYLRYHDIVGSPVGDGEDGKWHLLKP